jgi:hypothetical protein
MLQAIRRAGAVVLVPMERADDAARRWRERAVELRMIAETMADPTAVGDLYELANKWEAMARHAEERAADKVERTPE